MPAQESIPVSANVLGTIGTDSGASKIWANWRTKKTDGLPASMMFLWAICAVPFGAYNIVQNFNIPLQVQSQVFCLLALVSWAQILIYSSGWPVWKAALFAAILGAIFGGVETALIITLKPIYNDGVTYPMIIVGVIASVFLALGLLPPYYEIWKRRGRVIGINWVFLSLDWLGAFFSLMALVAQNTFDILGGVLYIICLFLELGILICHLIFLLRSRHIRRAAKGAGQTFDEHLAAAGASKFSERRFDFRFGKKRAEKDVESLQVDDVQNQMPVERDSPDGEEKDEKA